MPEPRKGRLRRIAAWSAAIAAGIAAFWMAHRQSRIARGRHRHLPSARALALGYEPHDIDAGAVARILLSLAVGATLCVGAVFLMIKILGHRDAARYADLTQEQVQPLQPPPPHLQVRPFVDLRAQRARENHLLHSYAWLDAAHTRARIPIDQAMKLVTGQSLDAQP